MKKNSLLILIVLFATLTYGQNMLNFSSQKITLKEAFNQLEKTGYSLSYGNGFDKDQNIQLPKKELSSKDLLFEIKRQTSLDFKTDGKSITFYPKANSNKSSKTVTISGKLLDSKTKEPIIGATIYNVNTKTGVTSDIEGKFSLNGTSPLNVKISYLGFKDTVITTSKNTSVSISMKPSSSKLSEVVVSGTKPNENVTSTEVSVEKLTIEQIEKIPIVMGETDIFKTIQMLPGINSVAEGRAGFIVRGGGLDQNLILMDGMPLYYTSHQRGLYSVFNSAAISEMTVYKGGVPARFGGRSSAVLDVRMTNGNFEKYTGEISLGLITSKFSLGAPIIKDKLSVFVAGRGTRWGFGYLSDEITRNSTGEATGGKGAGPNVSNDNPTFFQPEERWYDFNTKIIWKVNPKNSITFSGYYGKDFAYTEAGLTNWGNQAGHLKWKHTFNDKLLSNTSLIASRYNTFGDGGIYQFNSEIGTYSFRQEFSYFSTKGSAWRFGLQSEYQDFNHGSLVDQTQDDAGKYMPPMQGLESALYTEYEKTFKKKFAVHLGLRLSVYNRLGPGHTTVYDEESNEEISQTEFLGHSDVMATYVNPEPRASITYILNKKNSIKASYNRNAQYLRLMTLGSDITWYDIWMPSTENITPMLTDQVAVGYFRNFFNNKFEFSTEAYYKHQDGVSDFEDGLHNYLINNLEAYVAQGTGKAYGIEFSIEKAKGDFTGRISYNLGEALTTIEVINQGRPYNNMFDITHSLNSQFSYNPSKVRVLKDFTFSLNFVYYTGRPVTLPENYYYIGSTAMPYWEGRNQYRLPDYHRMDIGVKYEPEYLSIKTKNNRKIQPSVNISLYNIYNRRNIHTIDIVNSGSGKGGGETGGETGTNPSTVFSTNGRSTFGFVPSFQFNLKF